MTLYYLHGFASSSQSVKAVQARQFFASHYPQQSFVALDLAYTPADAMAQLTAVMNTAPPHAIIGSSLGGFLATVMAERYQCRACLINPAVAPHQVLSEYLGEYHHPVLQQKFTVQASHMAELEQLMPVRLRQPANYLVLLQSGDEVLDYRKAVSYYQGARLQVISGGDHSFQGFAGYLPAIADFCQLSTASHPHGPMSRK
ncbi:MULTISPECIES: YqiA/YcfP family alpha/beta fold hydrolase [unclassified Arsukibacterium]|uniref:YqiA/YcfP family alpha/beta fold hydrolase n=1 Tax=unclassified Arsukibacterium TaxID=2635278 RepID=UPI000C62C6C8|nr:MULTISPECIES: YqiA/YcfP family alpha/beta fold hydrolase [unclassified Arsukibacterium]MAA94700.1 esterase [Rheinheimera sp.]MBM33749.1 esterase [Rheinheimera sp.]